MMRQSYSNKRKGEYRQRSFVFLLRFFVGVVAVIVLALCFSTFLKQQEEMSRLGKERYRLEKERDRLGDEYEALKSLSAIADSNAYIERIAREYLDMARPGELLIICD